MEEPHVILNWGMIVDMEAVNSSGTNSGQLALSPALSALSSRSVVVSSRFVASLSLSLSFRSTRAAGAVAGICAGFGGI